MYYYLKPGDKVYVGDEFLSSLTGKWMIYIKSDKWGRKGWNPKRHVQVRRKVLRELREGIR